jgi:ankyrin repeat protein
LNISYVIMRLQELIKAANKGDKAVLQELEQELLKAAREGNKANLQKLIDVKGINLNAKDIFGNTALMLAAKEGHLAVVNLLIEKFPEGGGRVQALSEGLREAARWGYTEVVNLLIEKFPKDANPAEALSEGLREAARWGRSDVVNLLIEQFPEVGGRVQALSEGLREAARWGYTEVVKVLIEKFPEGANPVDALSEGLREAARWGHAEVVNLLIENLPKDANPVEALSESIKNAAWSGHTEVVNLLIENLPKDANPVEALSESIKNAAWSGHTEVVNLLMENLPENECVKASSEILPLVAWSGHLAVVKVLVEKLPEGDDRVEVLNRALLYAGEYGHEEVVQALLDAGANVNAVNYCGQTALILAVGNDSENVVKVLLEKAANRINFNATDNNGNTALMLAAEKGNKAIVLMLVKADVTAEDKAQALVLAKDDSIKSLLQQHESNAASKSVRVNAEVSDTGSGSLGASKNETSKGAPSYPKTQRALCLASAAAFTAGAYFLLAQSAVSTMMWGPVPVLYLALAGCAAVGALLGLALTTAYKDGFNDVAHSFYNWLGIAQDEAIALEGK